MTITSFVRKLGVATATAGLAMVVTSGVARDAAAQGFVATLSPPHSGGELSPQPPASGFDQILAAERLLYALGFSIDVIDGILDSSTTHAIRSFQRQNNLKLDGRVTPTLLTFLGQHVVDRIDGGDREDIIAAANDPEGLGFNADSRALVAFVQRTLARVGFDPGRVDGVLIPATHQAIRDFQNRDRIAGEAGVENPGEITPELVILLTDFEDDVLSNFRRLTER